MIQILMASGLHLITGAVHADKDKEEGVRTPKRTAMTVAVTMTVTKKNKGMMK